MIDAHFVWCFYHKCPEDRIEAEQNCAHHELVCVTRGLYDVQVGGARVQARPGDLVLLRANVPRTDANVAGSGLELLVVVFDWVDLPADWPLLERDADGRIALLVHWLHERWWWGRACEQEYSTAMLHAILAEYRHTQYFQDGPFAQQVREYVHAHVAEPLTLASLAAAFQMSRSNFARRFARDCALTPMTVVRQVRMAHARHLLQTSDLPLKQVAQAISLSDEVSLCHFFAKHLGMTPGEIRQRHGQTKEEAVTHYRGMTRSISPDSRQP